MIKVCQKVGVFPKIGRDGRQRKAPEASSLCSLLLFSKRDGGAGGGGDVDNPISFT
jgi:hypothetical protein